MAEASQLVKIEPLKGDNYQSWKYNMKLILMERGLWGFAIESEQVPAESASATVRNTYRLKSDKAYSLIALNVEKKLQIYVSTTTNPKKLGRY